MIKRAIEKVLVNDSGITAQLATYEFTTGTPAPAIFTSEVIPEDASFPAIIITLISGNPFGTRDSRGAETEVDVRLFDDRDRSDKAVRDLAQDVWRALDRVTLDLNDDGYEDWGTQADPPVFLDDPDGFPGYLVRVSSRYKEKE